MKECVCCGTKTSKSPNLIKWVTLDNYRNLGITGTFCSSCFAKVNHYQSGFPIDIAEYNETINILNKKQHTHIKNLML